jgi:hypothetical protein
VTQSKRESGDSSTTEPMVLSPVRIPMDARTRELARAAHAAYVEAVGGYNSRGDKLPDWDDELPESSKRGWMAAAGAVREMLARAL